MFFFKGFVEIKHSTQVVVSAGVFINRTDADTLEQGYCVIQPPTQCRRPRSKGTKPSKLGSLSFYLSRGHRASSKPACIAQLVVVGWSYRGKLHSGTNSLHLCTIEHHENTQCNFTTSINTSHSGPTFSRECM